MPFGKRVDRPAGRRRMKREEVVLAASARSIGSSRTVVVTDVSARGAKLQGRDLGSLDSNVMISFGAIDLFARIAWTAHDECGIIFEDKLESDAVARIKREGGWARVMGIAA